MRVQNVEKPADFGEQIICRVGFDIECEQKRVATMAGSVKSILDTPILTEDGALTEESQKLVKSLGVKLLEK